MEPQRSISRSKLSSFQSQSQSFSSSALCSSAFQNRGAKWPSVFRLAFAKAATDDSRLLLRKSKIPLMIISCYLDHDVCDVCVTFGKRRVCATSFIELLFHVKCQSGTGPEKHYLLSIVKKTAAAFMANFRHGKC